MKDFFFRTYVFFEKMSDKDTQGYLYMFKCENINFRKIGRTDRNPFIRVQEWSQDTGVFCELLWWARVKKNAEAESRLFKRLAHVRANRLSRNDTVVFVNHKTSREKADVLYSTNQTVETEGMKREVEWFHFSGSDQELKDEAEHVVKKVNNEFSEEPWHHNMVDHFHYVYVNTFNLSEPSHALHDSPEKCYLMSFLDFLRDDDKLMSISKEILEKMEAVLKGWMKVSASASSAELAKTLSELDNDESVLSFPGHSCALVYDKGKLFTIPTRPCSSHDCARGCL